jgi:chromosome segregation and condensation protein ScpB
LADNENLLSTFREIPWQDYTEERIAKYRKASGYANPHPAKEEANKTLAIISQNPGIRRKEIHSLFGRDPGNFLKILLEERKIRKEQIGRAVHYYLSKKE